MHVGDTSHEIGHHAVSVNNDMLTTSVCSNKGPTPASSAGAMCGDSLGALFVGSFFYSKYFFGALQLSNAFCIVVHGTATPVSF